MQNKITIDTLLDKIYKIIDRSIVRYQLQKDSTKWNQICCALDLIRDADAGFCSFLNKQDYSDYAEQYIYIYGVFQLLQTQQDAFYVLFTLLSGEVVKKNTFLKEIKHIAISRSLLVAHPTEQREDKNTKIGFITRGTLKGGKFEYSIVTTSDQNKKISNEAGEVDLHECIKSQSEHMVKQLETLIDKVQQKYTQDMTDIKKELQECLPETLNYDVRKLAEFANNYAYFAKEDENKKDNTAGSFNKFPPIIHLEIIKTATIKLHKVISKHFNAEEFSDLFSTLNYAVNELECSFKNCEISINSNLLIIFAGHIREKIDSLKEWVLSIDQEFELNDFQSINP